MIHNKSKRAIRSAFAVLFSLFVLLSTSVLAHAYDTTDWAHANNDLPGYNLAIRGDLLVAKNVDKTVAKGGLKWKTDITSTSGENLAYALCIPDNASGEYDGGDAAYGYITFTNAALDNQGKKYDVKITISNVSVGPYAIGGGQLLGVARKKGDLPPRTYVAAEAGGNASGGDGTHSDVKFDVTVEVVDAPEGARTFWKFYDLDVADPTHGEYQESIQFLSKPNSPIIAGSNITSNDAGTKFWGNGLDSNTDKSAVAAIIPATGYTVRWRGTGWQGWSAGTDLFVNSESYIVTEAVYGDYTEKKHGYVSNEGQNTTVWHHNWGTTVTVGEGMRIKNLQLDRGDGKGYVYVIQNGKIVEEEATTFKSTTTGGVLAVSSNNDKLEQNRKMRVSFEPDAVKVWYKWGSEHPNREVPAGKDDITIGSSYTLDKTYQKGMTVDETNVTYKGKTYDQGTWTFEGWDKPNSFTVNEDTEIVGTWTFVPKWNITTEVVNGDITPDILGIPNGENRTVSYSPHDGYLLSEIVVDGTPLQDPMSKESSYPFNNVTEDHHIKVVYEKQGNPVKAVKNAERTDIHQKYVDAGDNLFYEITVTNPTKIDYDYKVTDKVPEGVKFVNADNGGSEKNGIITWNVKVPAGKPMTLKWTAATTGKGLTINNKADMTVKKITLPTNTVTNYTPLDPKKDVTLDGKSIDRDMRIAGNVITYVIDLENIATVDKTFMVKDPIPAGLVFQSASDSGRNVEGTVTWSLPMPAGAKKTITWSALIDESAKDTVLVNNVEYDVDEADDPEVPPEERPETPVFKDPVKTVTRVIDGERRDINQLLVSKDSQLDYTITWHNPAHDAKEFTVTDIIPEHTRLIEESIQGNGGVVDENGKITWTVTLQPDAYGEVSFSVITTEKDVHIPNKGNVAVDEVNLDTNTVENWIPRQPRKSVYDENGEPFEFGEVYIRDGRQVKYVIDYHNNSTLTKEFTITDPLPEGLIFVSAENGGEYDEETRTITWHDTVGAGEEKEVSFTCEIDPTVIGTWNSVVDNIGITASDLWEDEEGEIIHPVPEMVDIPVVKLWPNYDENKDPMKPTSIDVMLYRRAEDGTLQHVSDLTLYAKNNWSGSFLSVVAYPNMAEAYVIREKNSTMEGFVSQTRWVPAEEIRSAEQYAQLMQNPAYKDDMGGFVVENVAGTSDPVKDVVDENNISINGKTVAVGDTLTYTITWKNNYDSVVDLQIVDPIPEKTTYVDGSADNGGKYIDGRREVQYQIDDINPGDTVTVSFKVTVDEDASGTITNNAKVRSDRDPSFIVTNTVINIVDPPPVKDVLGEEGTSINKERVEVGQKITYAVTVENTNDKAAVYTITDALPSAVKFIDASDNGAEKDGVVTWEISVGPMSKYTVYANVEVTSDALNVIKNIAEIEKDKSGFKTPTNEVENPVDPKPIQPVKAVLDKDGNDIDKQEVLRGDELTYRISFKNTSAHARVFDISDAVPEKTTFMHADNAGTENDGIVTWRVLAEGDADVVVTFTVKVAEDAEGTIVNGATVTTYTPDPENPEDPNGPKKTPTPEEPGTPGEPIPTNDVENPVKLPAPAAVEVVKSANPEAGTKVKAGETIEYILTATNSGETDAKSVVIRDAIPENTTYVEGSAKDASFKDGKLQWVLETLAAGDSKTVTFKVTVNDVDKATTITNFALYEDDFDPENPEDPKTSTNIVDHPVEVPTPPTPPEIIEGSQVTVYKTSDPKPNSLVKAGDTITYRFNAKNTGTTTSGYTVIRDEIPAGTTYVEGSVSKNGAYVEDGNYVEFVIKGIEPNKEYKGDISFAVKVDDGMNGVVKNFGTFITVPEDPGDPGTTGITPDLQSNTVYHPTNKDVPAPPVIEVVKTSKPAPGTTVKAGEKIEYTLTVMNTGGSTANSIVVRDACQKGLSYVDGSADNGGIFREDLNQLQWIIKTLEPKQKAELKFSATVTGTATLVKNQAVYEDNFDPKDDKTPKNSSNIVEHPAEKVEPKAPVKEVKNASGADINGKTVAVGDELYYYIHFTNSASKAQSMTVTDAVPKGTEFVSADNQGKLQNGVVTWTVKVSAGQTATVSMKVKVKEANATIENIAKVTDPSGKSTNTNKVTNKTTATPTPTPTQEPAKPSEISSGAKTGDVNMLPIILVGAGAAVIAVLALKKKKKA